MTELVDLRELRQVSLHLYGAAVAVDTCLRLVDENRSALRVEGHEPFAHRLERRLELRAAAVGFGVGPFRFDPSRLFCLEKAGALQRQSGAVRELQEKVDVVLIVLMSRLGPVKTDHAERPAARPKRDHGSRSHTELAQKLEMFFV